MAYQPVSERYDTMRYNRCGRSGLKLPAISLGLWHNFGHNARADTARLICERAFDLGVTHFDLANNYGPPPGSAEALFGEILATTFHGLRDELVISTKAGYNDGPGPYMEWGSRKYLTASLDRSLKRMGIDYVDIFYSHRFDPDTPLEETMGALDSAVRQGKALYVGISSYNARRTAEAAAILRGIRNTSDVANECQLAITNRKVADVETVFIVTGEEYAYTSSSLIKQVAAFGGALDRLNSIVSPLVIEKLREKLDDPSTPLAKLASHDQLAD